MATAGLSFANPLLSKVSVGEEPNPYAPFSPTSGIGMGGLGPSAADMAVMGEQLATQGQFTMPEMTQPPAIAFSPTRNEFFVQGTTFSADDAPAALQAEGLLGGPGTGLPTEGDWQPLDVGAYQQYLSSIRNPSPDRLFSKGFAIGGQNLKQLAGSALQLAGAEQTGGALVESAQQRLQQLSPYQRQFTDVEFGSADRGIVDWFVANLGQQGPMLLESVAMGLAGAAAGSAAAGPGLGTAGGFLAGVFGKKQFKEKVLEAATKYRTGGAAALNATETKLLKNASALTGAAAANFASSQVTGAGDIYGEMREQGVGPEDFGARMTALAGSFPYALAESSTEFLLAGRVLGGFMAPRPMAAGATRTARGAELLRRGAVGAGVGAVAEGSTELFQEGLVMGLSGQDLTSDDAVKRFINSFAAGAAIGGGLGGVANLRGRNPDGTPSAEAKAEVNLLDSTPPPAPIPTSAQMGLPLEGGMVSYPATEFAPGAQPGAQGVLDVGLPGQPLAPEEVAMRQQGLPAAPAEDTRVAEQMDLFAQPQAPQMRQMEVGLAPPAPTGIGFTEQQPAPNTLIAQQMQIAQRRQQEAQMQQQRAQQEAAQREAQLQQLAVQAQNQRQLDIAAQQAEPPAPFPSMPMRPAGPVQPQQLPLFTRRQAPVPPRAGQLRRGGQMQPVAAEPQDRGIRQASLQLPMFTAEGEPTLPALRGAALKTTVAPATPRPARINFEGQEYADTPRIRSLIEQAVQIISNLPNVGVGKTRLWRGVRPGETGQNPSFTNSLVGIALPFAESYGGGLAYVDVPTADLGKYVQTGAVAPGAEFILPPELAAKAKSATPKPRATKTAGARGLKKGARVAAVEVKETPSAVPKPSPAPVPAQPRAEAAPKSEVLKAKTEAKVTPPAAAPETKAPVPITLELPDGTKVKAKDGTKLLAKLDGDVSKMEKLLACLKAAA
jgi:hypothetical protein